MWSEYRLERSATIDGPGCSDIEWAVDLHDYTWTIAVQSAPSSDWVAVGLSENGGMKGADILLVKRKSQTSDVLEVQDRYSSDFVEPALDVVQNVEMLDSSIDDDGRILALLKRKLDTCDFSDDVVLPYKQHLICASGKMSEKGDILYHGNNYGKAFVNLFINEEVLFEAKLGVDGKVENGNETDTVSTQLSKGVTLHGDPEKAVEPLPLDIQLTNNTVNASKVTHYHCAVIDIPFDASIIAFESVWGQAESVSSGKKQPDFMHHQQLLKCDDTGLMDPDSLSGDVYDCYENMPPCSGRYVHSRTGLVRALPNVNMPLEKGLYVLMVHYNNRAREVIQDDASGLRFWIEPPNVKSRTTPGQLLAIHATFHSIVIPPSERQKDYDLQLMLPSSATQDLLLPGGVDVFVTQVHMHNRGKRSKVQLFRNGEYLNDVYKTKSYDFNSQSPQYKPWKLLPGDSLLVTCTFTPLTDKTVYGGYSNEDEMCITAFGMVPEVPGFTYTIGNLVRPGQAFEPVYSGPWRKGIVPAFSGGQEAFMTFRNENGLFPPDPMLQLDPPRSQMHNVCENTVRDIMQLPSVSVFSYPEIPAQVYTIAIFLLIVAIGSIVKPIRKMNNERKERNTIVYICQLLFSTVALPIMLTDLVKFFSISPSTFDAINVSDSLLPRSRSIIVIQAMLYLVELFYRIKVRWEVIMHHLLTSFMVMFIFAIGDMTFAFGICLKIGMLLTMMALTEQPFYLALITKNLGYDIFPWWKKLCLFAGWSFILMKLALIILIVVVLIEPDDKSWELGSHSFSEWKEVEAMNRAIFVSVVSVSMALLFVVQALVGRIMIQLAHRSLNTSDQEKVDLDLTGATYHTEQDNVL